MQFFTSVITARLLLPNEIGIVSLVTVFSGFLILFLESGISFLVIRTNYKRHFWKSLSALIIRIGIILFVLLTFLSYPIAIFYQDLRLVAVTIVISLMFLIQPLGVIPRSIILKNQDFKVIGISAFINAFAVLLITSLCLFMNYSFWSVIIGTISGKIFEVIYLINKSGFPPFFGEKKHLIIGWKNSKTLILSSYGFSLINYWGRNLDNLIIGKYYGAKDLGLYSKAYSLLTFLLNIIRDTIGVILFPILKEHKDKTKHHTNIFYTTLNFTYILVTPISLIFIFFPEEIVMNLWGENWITSAPIIQYFGILLQLQPLIRMSGNIILIENHDKALFNGGLGILFSVVGIIYGSTISVTAIAQYYCLSNVTFTTIYSVWYIYLKTLKVPVKNVFKFWGVKLILANLFWVGISYNFDGLMKILALVTIIYLFVKVINLFKTKNLLSK